MSIPSVRPLCPELKLIAESEVNETPKRLEEGIKHLQEWISKTPHLKARTDDQWLAGFLRGCKYSIEKTKQKIDLFYTLRTIAPEVISLKFYDPKFEEQLKTGIGLILPKRASPSSPRVVYVRISEYDPDKVTPADFLSVVYVCSLMSIMKDDALMIAGLIIIFDLTAFGMGHFAQASVEFIKKFALAGQDASPVRLKAAHFVGMPSYLQVLFNIAKEFLNEKNKQRIHVHKDFEELRKHIPNDVLPQEYGGSGGFVQDIIDMRIKDFINFKSFLEEDLQYGTDETRRPGNQKSADSYLGIDGSFRQLDFD